MNSVQTKAKHIPHEIYIQQLKVAKDVIFLDQLKVGGFYLFKENFGMVSVVKVLEINVEEAWTGFRLMVKQVIHSAEPIPKGKIFEVGYNCQVKRPSSWHFEPSLSLVE